MKTKEVKVIEFHRIQARHKKTTTTHPSTVFKSDPYPANLIYLNFNSLEVVYRYRDPQLQVGENYSYLLNLRQNICKILLFKRSLQSQYHLFDLLMKWIKNDYSRDQQAKG